MVSLGFLGGCADTVTQELPPAMRLSEAPSFSAAQARNMINAYRVTKGRRPLPLNAKLTQAARIQATDMARRDTMTHKGSDGSDVSARVARTGYAAGLAAENVAAGQHNFQEVLDGWKKSSSHNRNLLLSDAAAMGIAMDFSKSGKYQTYWVLVLAAPRR